MGSPNPLSYFLLWNMVGRLIQDYAVASCEVAPAGVAASSPLQQDCIRRLVTEACVCHRTRRQDVGVLVVVAGCRSSSVRVSICRRLFPIRITEVWLDFCTLKGMRHHVLNTACVDRYSRHVLNKSNITRRRVPQLHVHYRKILTA